MTVREEIASRLSSHETTGWKPVFHDRQDAYPPAKTPAAREGNRDDVRGRRSHCGSAWDQILDGFALFKELGDGCVDLLAAEGVDGQTLNDFPSPVVEGPDRHRCDDAFGDAVGTIGAHGH